MLQGPDVSLPPLPRDGAAAPSPPSPLSHRLSRSLISRRRRRRQQKQQQQPLGWRARPPGSAQLPGRPRAPAAAPAIGAGGVQSARPGRSGRFKPGRGGRAAKFPPATSRASRPTPPHHPRAPGLRAPLVAPRAHLAAPGLAPPSSRHVHAAVLRLHAGASGLRVRGAAARGEPGAAGPLPLVAARLRPPAQERERAQGQGGGGLPPRQLPRALQDPGEPPVLGAQPPQAAAALAQGALRGGRETAGPAAGRRGQVPRAAEVPAAPHHMGRRGDQLLLQGEVPRRAARVVRAQPLPLAAGEARAGRGHRPHHHAGQQLVQEPAAAGPGGGGEGKGEHREQQRGHRQSQPALPAGRGQGAHVQLGRGILPAAEPGPELSPAAPGKPQPCPELQLFPERPNSLPGQPQPPGLPARTAHFQPGRPRLLKPEEKRRTRSFAAAMRHSSVHRGQDPTSQRIW